MPAVDPEIKIPVCEFFWKALTDDPCPTPQHLQAELDAFAAVLALGEKEDTWEKIEKAVFRFSVVTRGGGYKHLPLFADGLGRKGLGLNIAACVSRLQMRDAALCLQCQMLSDRGRLSGATTDLLQTFAPRLSTAFAPLVSLYLEPLVRLLGRPNKVFLKRAEKCLMTIISRCHIVSIAVELRKGLNDEAAICRRGCAAGLERTLDEWEKELWDPKISVLEDAMRKMATDKDPEVRRTGKAIWLKYTEIWSERVDE